MTAMVPEGCTEKSIVEHADFVHSVLIGDEQRAETQMRDHLTRVRDDLIQLVKRLVLPFSSSGF